MSLFSPVPVPSSRAAFGRTGLPSRIKPESWPPQFASSVEARREYCGIVRWDEGRKGLRKHSQ